MFETLYSNTPNATTKTTSTVSSGGTFNTLFTSPTPQPKKVEKPKTESKPVAKSQGFTGEVIKLVKSPIIGKVLEIREEIGKYLTTETKKLSNDLKNVFTLPFKQAISQLKPKSEKDKKELESIYKSKLSLEEKANKANKILEKYGGPTEETFKSAERGAEFGMTFTKPGGAIPEMGAVEGNLKYIFKQGVSKLTGKGETIANIVGKESKPQEVINTVFQNGLEKTPDGKGLIKTAVQAQKQGKNVVAEEVMKPTAPKGGVGVKDAQAGLSKNLSKSINEMGNVDINALNEKYLGKNLRPGERSSALQRGVLKDVNAGLYDAPAELRDLARNTVWGNYSKEKFLQQFEQGLKNQNLTKRETVQNIVNVLKKNGLTPSTFYDKYASRIAKINELESKMSRATGDSNKYNALLQEWQKVKYEGLSRNPEEMAIAQKALDESIGKSRVAQPTIGGVKPKVEVKPKEVSVPREQLPVASKEGIEKVSRLEARVTKSLDKTPQEIKDQLGSTFTQMNKKENIAKASKYVIDNPDDAMAVLRGEKEAPKGLLKNSIYVAMENQAVGDTALARKLASLQSTRAGQELSILTEIDTNSPVKIMRDIVKVREEAFVKKYGGKKPKEVADKIVGDIKKKVKVADKYDWNRFVQSLPTC